MDRESLGEREQSMRSTDPGEIPREPHHEEIALIDPQRPQMLRRTYSYGDSDEEFRAYGGEMGHATAEEFAMVG
jgi:hypothetical protein